MTFHEWFASAQPGESYTYYIGWLSKDHGPLWPSDVVDARLAYNTGWVDLVAERVNGGARYIAIRRKRRARIQPWEMFQPEHLQV